jgi:hypothetical protein
VLGGPSSLPPASLPAAAPLPQALPSAAPAAASGGQSLLLAGLPPPPQGCRPRLNVPVLPLASTADAVSNTLRGMLCCC